MVNRPAKWIKLTSLHSGNGVVPKHVIHPMPSGLWLYKFREFMPFPQGDEQGRPILVMRLIDTDND
eukprot:1158303-Pelagomonas_calceolata.AAC.5